MIQDYKVNIHFQSISLLKERKYEDFMNLKRKKMIISEQGGTRRPRK